MRAVVIREHGSFDKLVLEDLPVPEPGPAEVRVNVRAAALNHLDTWVRRGIPGFEFPLPIIPGCDGAGVIDAVGAACPGLEPGMEVVLSPGIGHPLDRDYGILGETRDGTCTDHIIVPRDGCVQKPESLDWDTAGCFSLTFLTAWHMLVRNAKIQPGEWVLIHAAGSGVGIAAAEICRLFGARVIVTASTEEKRQRALDLGAEHALPYEGFAKAARLISGKRGLDVVVDHVGPATWEGSVACLRKGGRIVTCGGTGGHEITFDVRHLFFKSLSFLGSTMGSLADWKRVVGHVGAGRLTPVIDSRFALENIADAHRRIAERAVFGKVVVTL
jgi:NADPH:quinone reductase-like Zn-dependent oxidoreductase